MIRQAFSLLAIAAVLGSNAPAAADELRQALKQQWWLLEASGGSLQPVWFEESGAGRLTMRCAAPTVPSQECNRFQPTTGRVQVDTGSNGIVFKTSTGERLMPHWVVPTPGSRHGH